MKSALLILVCCAVAAQGILFNDKYKGVSRLAAGVKGIQKIKDFLNAASDKAKAGSDVTDKLKEVVNTGSDDVKYFLYTR